MILDIVCWSFLHSIFVVQAAARLLLNPNSEHFVLALLITNRLAGLDSSSGAFFQHSLLFLLYTEDLHRGKNGILVILNKKM